MWKPCDPEGHAWEAIPMWNGRYRCRSCAVIGYRAAVLPRLLAEAKGPGSIIPYRCPDCHGPTTRWRRKRAFERGVRDGVQPCPACV